MFIDEVIIKVEAGKGGDGCSSFRREKFVPHGGPDGGNGGQGSNIIFKVDDGLHTLLDLRYLKNIKGKKGENGSGKNKNGKNAEDIIIKVPKGSIIKDLDSNYILADLTKKNEEFLVATGGRGGRGNKAFVSSVNTAPSISEYGELGEKKTIKIELKLLADVGLVGLPNVGKSTILSKVSASKAKIDSYPFTTLTPNLGVVKTKDHRSFVMADLPGLIKGASLGEGLGDQFLKHIERTKIIAHVIDMSGIEGRDPIIDFKLINEELKAFKPSLLDKPQIVIANKMDLLNAESNYKKFQEKIKLPIFKVSAVLGTGLDLVLIKLADMLQEIKEHPLHQEEEMESYVLYKFKEEKPFIIESTKEGWLVQGKEVERLLQMTKFSNLEATIIFAKKLRKMGIDEELKKRGAKNGDLVKILDYEFEYTE